MSAARSHFWQFDHEAMNTTFQLLIAGEDKEYAGQVSIEVFREIDRLESVLSRFALGSDISLINHLQPGQSMQVGIEVIECLELSWRIRQETNGAFDITYAAGATPAEQSPSTPPLTGMDWLAVITDEDDPQVPTPRAAMRGFTVGIRTDVADTPFPGACIDLGAVGKGYALDKAAEILTDWNIPNAVLNSGTSTVLTLGELDPGGWPLGLGGAWGEQVGLQRVLLTNRALSGSGTDVQGQHIVDPRTGQPGSGHISAWVAAPTAALSDALSTAFFVMTTAEVEAYCAGHPEISALVVSRADGKDRVGTYGEWVPVPGTSAAS